tara:strand:+ start:89 stop:256 length:168 start_codon:yes stop_codon:yes gene_type:complete
MSTNTYIAIAVVVLVGVGGFLLLQNTGIPQLNTQQEQGGSLDENLLLSRGEGNLH